MKFSRRAFFIFRHNPMLTLSMSYENSEESGLRNFPSFAHVPDASNKYRIEDELLFCSDFCFACWQRIRVTKAEFVDHPFCKFIETPEFRATLRAEHCALIVGIGAVMAHHTTHAHTQITLHIRKCEDTH